MRSFLIIFFTLLIAVGLFAAYSWYQPALPKRPPKSTASSAVRTPRPMATTTQQSVHGVGGIENPWVKRFENGELTSQFRSLRSTPKGGDVVEVTKPEAQFFSGDGSQMLVVEGVSGEVIVPGGGGTGSGASGGGNFSPPSRGQVRDVKISMFEPADAAEPTLIATMPNAVFDNDTFRISTEAYTDDAGKRIEADQVPVVVEGRDYDFRGRGLVIRWNQRDRRLQLLEVQHGESLTVKNFDAMSLDRKGEGARGRGVETEMLASVDPIAPAMLLAAAQSKAKKATPRPAPVTTKASTRDTSPVVYRATFERDVKIFEAEKPVATAERLEIDILQVEDDHATATSTQPSTRASRRDRRRTDATSAPTTNASTSPVQGPVTVKWTGKLRVVPLEEPADPALVAGKAIVRMTGSPVVIDHADMQARAGVVAFNSADGSASLRANEIVPIVEMTTTDGSKVTTPSVTYTTVGEKRRIATLTGKSTAVLTAKGQKGPLTLSWSKDGRIQFVEPTPGKSVMEDAAFAGDVRIVHPDLDMTAQTLALKFDTTRPANIAPTTSPADVDPADSLRQIVADGGVNCRITEAGADARQIESNKLVVNLDRSPAGETYARYIEASGGVRTTQDKDSLSAGELRAELAPSTQPSAKTATVDASDAKPANSPFGGSGSQLRSLVATNAVKLATQDGSSATADKLEVKTVNGHESYLLEGNPVATVTQGKTVISGPQVRFSPDEQLAEVVGAGGMKGTLPDDPKQSFDVTWAGGATVNGVTNRIDVTQQIVLGSKQDDGTVNTATSDQLQATLMPKPATQPSAVNAAAVAATKPSQKDKMNFLAGKEVTTATLLADAGKRVEVKSELLGLAGGLLRGINLYATKIVTNRATGRLDVPVPGEMLYQDHRPPEEKAAGKPAGDGPTLGSGRGNTAFRWTESLAYDDMQKRVTMKGDVEVVHHPEAGAKDAQPFNLWSDVLLADLEPDPDAAKPKAAAGVLATPAKPSQPKMRLKLVTAAGRVRVQSTRLNIDASRLSYDPVAGVLRAAGAEGAPITVIDNQKGTSSTAGELEWNTKTDQFRIKELSGKVRT